MQGATGAGILVEIWGYQHLARLTEQFLTATQRDEAIADSAPGADTPRPTRTDCGVRQVWPQSAIVSRDCEVRSTIRRRPFGHERHGADRPHRLNAPTPRALLELGSASLNQGVRPPMHA